MYFYLFNNMENLSKIKVRFAPSPTGHFHIGSARTALFNFLFARKKQGQFILRIEDTDKERSKKEYEKEIIESLKWLELNFDEGPFRQSERREIYKKYIEKLLNEGKAYHCYCTKEELEAEREAMLSQGLPPKYSGKCRNKPYDPSKPSVIRFKMPEKEVEFNDLIRGKVKFDTSLIGDIVIAKDPETPLYNLASVIDDYEMGITHIIRGEDHLSNTPKQICLQEAFGFPRPIYAHLPLILSSDRKKLSKRFLEGLSVSDFKKQGYLASALNNFLAFLGWHPAKEKYIYINLKELIEDFDLKKIQKSGAVYNPNRLNWLNYQHIIRKSNDDLIKEIESFVPVDWKKNPIFPKVVELEKTRIKKLSDFKYLASFFFELPSYPEELLFWAGISKENILENLKISFKTLESLDEKYFTTEKLKDAFIPLTEAGDKGALLWPLRVALSGQKASPPPFEIAEIIGKKEALNRIKIAIEKVR